jgi:hypothetical protein
VSDPTHLICLTRILNYALSIKLTDTYTIRIVSESIRGCREYSSGFSKDNLWLEEKSVNWPYNWGISGETIAASQITKSSRFNKIIEKRLSVKQFADFTNLSLIIKTVYESLGFGVPNPKAKHLFETTLSASG